MANPFGITQVDIPGVFGAVQQFKQNALNLQIGEEKLNAFRQDRETQRQVRGLKSDVIAGQTGAVERLAAVDTGEAKDLVDLFGEMNEQERERVEQSSLELARTATNALGLKGNERKQFVAEFIKDHPEFRGKVSENPSDEELLRFVTDAQTAATLFNVLNPKKKSASPIAIGFRDANGELVAESFIDLANDPDAIAKLNEAAKQGKAVFDPSKASAGQGIGTVAQRFEAQEEFNDKQEATANLVKETSRLLEQVESAGTKAIGFTGGVTRLVDNFAEQLGATSELLGFRDRADAILADIGGNTENRFKQIANESAVIASNLKSLAYLTAKSRFGQTGRGLSDKDFENALKIVAGAAQSPSQMVAVLRENITAVVSQLETAAQAGGFDFSIEAFREQFGLDGLQGDNLPLITDQAEFDALPSGAKYRETPNGPIFEKP